jgi:signal peptidase I
MKHLDDSSHRKEDALKCELAAETLRWFGTLRLQVTGHSMLPTIWPGDVLLAQRCDFGGIRPGEIVLYARESRLVAHRVISKGAHLEGPFLVTQGDTSPTQDSPVSPAEFLGRVSIIIRAGKFYIPVSTLTLESKLVAIAARHSTFASRFLVHRHLTRFDSGGQKTLC